MAATLLTNFTDKSIPKEKVLDLLRALQYLYPNQSERFSDSVGLRFFISPLIESFSLADITWFLDRLSREVSCTCNARAPYNCDCRNGISKIIARLMNRYFALATPPFDPEQIWNWCKELNFHAREPIPPLQSSCVDHLRKDHNLRRTLQKMAFNKNSTANQIRAARNWINGFNSFAGLRFQNGDELMLITHAFKTQDIDLWLVFYKAHNPDSDRGENPVRALMRKQARSSDIFCKAWHRRESAQARSRYSKQKKSFGLTLRKYRKDQQRKFEATKKSLELNRDKILSGNHEGVLQRFTHGYLWEPKKLLPYFEDLNFVENTLINALPKIRTALPAPDESINTDADDSQRFVAGCLAMFKKDGCLKGLDENELQILKASSESYYLGIEKPFQEAFQAEVNRQLLTKPNSAELFARRYIEPILRDRSAIDGARAHILRESEFSDCRSGLALEWMQNFSPDTGTLQVLFDLCRDEEFLLDLIKDKCQGFETFDYKNAEGKEKKIYAFWLLRAFFFLPNEPEFVWEYIASNANNIFLIEEVLGWGNRYAYSHWPDLPANKIHKILVRFIKDWPPVKLPSSHGSESPQNEKAYRFLTKLVYKFELIEPDEGICYIDELIASNTLSEVKDSLLHLRARCERRRRLSDFMRLKAKDVANALNTQVIASIYDLQAVILDNLDDIQKWVNGAPTTPLNQFYENGKNVNENTARDRIMDRLQGQVKSFEISINKEDAMPGDKRCDMTAEVKVSGKSLLLPIEVKGQWNRELYTAAENQLIRSYATHHQAHNLGIYLVLWYGTATPLVGNSKKSITSAEKLKIEIERKISKENRPFVKVFVLDLAREP